MVKNITAIFISIFVSFFSKSQDFENALKRLAENDPAEKLHMQFDQEYYVPGEMIWFKAYFYNEQQPSNASSNLFVQLLDNKGRLISDGRYPVIGAVSVGNIVLPDSLSQGNYFIRAFTSRMLEHSPGLIYTQKIPVVKSGIPAIKTPSVLSTIQFYPESGRLVDSIPTLVALRTTDPAGLSIAVAGLVKSSDGNTVSSFKTEQNGVGKFVMIPVAGKRYNAEVQLGDKKLEFEIPYVYSTGVVLHVEDEPEGKLFQLSRSVSGKDSFSQVSLVVQLNQRIVYENTIDFEEYFSVKGHLLTEGMPSGILHFTVFDKKGTVLAQRLSFVNNEEFRSEATISVIKKGLGKRAENIIELSFPDALLRSCAITVVDATDPVPNEMNSIYADLLLTGDLDSPVKDAGTYFGKPDPSKLKMLDDLLLMQKWSRFNWSDVLSKNSKKTSSTRPLISLSGKVMDEKKKENLSGGRLEIFLEASDSTTQSLQAAVDEKGDFHVDSLLFFGNAKLFYAYIDKNEKQRDSRMILNEDPVIQKINSFPFLPPVAEDLNTKSSTVLTERLDYTKSRLKEIKELEKVTLKSKGKRPSDIVNEKYATGVFQGQAKVVLDNINNPVSDNSLTALDFIRNRIQEIEVTSNGIVNRKNMSMRNQQRWPVGIFVNEIPTDISTLRLTRVSDVALVKFFEAGFVGVSSTFPGGAVVVYTKQPSENEIKPSKLPFVQVKGYTEISQFNSPDYSTKDSKNSATDSRATLYWNSDVLFDRTTNTKQFRFFNNDSAKKIKVIVEGFDAKGRLIHLEKVIE